MKIFETTAIRNLNLKNRVVMPPMCMYEVHKHDGIATNFHRIHYTARAIGQVGLIIVEATGVSPEGRITDRCLGLWNDPQRDALKEIVENVHEQGSKIAIQLNHAGRKSEAVDGVDIIYAPSRITYSERYRIPNEMTVEDINRVIQDFKKAAKRADEAGFDAIELHAAHGYLISEFMSPMTNHRTDKYKDPTVFLKELLTEVKSVWPQEKPIIVRVSATDYEENGYNTEDCAKMLQAISDDIDVVHVSSGGITSKAPPAFPGYQVDMATRIKEVTGLPVIAVGLITTIEQAIEIVENGRADFVAIGRGLLRNPHWYLEGSYLNNQKEIIPNAYRRGFR